MAEPSAADVARELTGLCTYLVQGPSFEAGDEAYLVLKRDPDGLGTREWQPLTALPADEERTDLTATEAGWGAEVLLVRATLAATGGQPRDSMNQPADDYDPEALTLADVTVVDRHPPA